jgi:copper(I)-binding protein
MACEISPLITARHLPRRAINALRRGVAKRGAADNRERKIGLGNSNQFHLIAIATLFLTITIAVARADDLSVTNAWIRALPSSVPSGGYFTLHNGGAKKAVLTGAESAACSMLMLHRSEDKGGMGCMMDVVSVDVAAGETVKFAPGDYHLMCMDAKAQIRPGNGVPVTLVFADGRRLTVNFQVRNAAGK